jgi:hypothetical protein
MVGAEAAMKQVCRSPTGGATGGSREGLPSAYASSGTSTMDGAIRSGSPSPMSAIEPTVCVRASKRSKLKLLGGTRYYDGTTLAG